MIALLIVAAVIVLVIAVERYLNPHSLRGRWRDLFPDEPDPKACDPDAVAEYIRKHQKG